MKRKFFTHLSMLTIICVLLSACGSATTPAPPATQAPAAPPPTQAPASPAARPTATAKPPVLTKETILQRLESYKPVFLVIPIAITWPTSWRPTQPPKVTDVTAFTDWMNETNNMIQCLTNFVLQNKKVDEKTLAALWSSALAQAGKTHLQRVIFVYVMSLYVIATGEVSLIAAPLITIQNGIEIDPCWFMKYDSNKGWTINLRPGCTVTD